MVDKCAGRVMPLSEMVRFWKLWNLDHSALFSVQITYLLHGLMLACMCAYTHTETHTCTHKHMRTQTHTHHTHTSTHTHTCTHACMDAYMHACMHGCTHARTLVWNFTVRGVWRIVTLFYICSECRAEAGATCEGQSVSWHTVSSHKLLGTCVTYSAPGQHWDSQWGCRCQTSPRHIWPRRWHWQSCSTCLACW